MLTFESEKYTVLTLFPNIEAEEKWEVTLTDGRKKQTLTAEGPRPLTFYMETDTEYTLFASAPIDGHIYLHGNACLENGGVHYLRRESRTYDLHYAPPCGWVGGPTVFIRFNDQYHIFYMWNPFARTSERIYWGHAAGTDLLHLFEMPVAVMPPEELQISNYRCGGAIGGSAALDEGKIKILFSSCILDKTMKPISIGYMEMMSRDMVYFSEPECARIDICGYCPTFSEEHLLTCGSFHGKGVIHLHKKEDGVWKKTGVLFKDAKNPYLHTADFFKVRRTHAILAEGKDGVARWVVGTYKEEKFRKRAEGRLDVGAFHMPCVLSEGAERILLGSIGNRALSLPRRLYTKHGKLCAEPIKAVYDRFSSDGTGRATFFRLTGNRETDAFAQIGPIRLKKEGEVLWLETEEDRQRFSIKAEKAELFVDGDIAELFINDGELVYSFLLRDKEKIELLHISGDWKGTVQYFLE